MCFSKLLFSSRIHIFGSQIAPTWPRVVVYLYCSVFLLVFFGGFRLWLWDVVVGA